MALGNIIGANIYNLLAIMGLVAAVTPITVPPQILKFDLWFMLSVTVALLFTVLVRKRLDRGAAVMFLVAFAGYTALQYYGVENVLN